MNHVYFRHPVEDIEPDQDNDLSDLVPKVSRLFGWISEGRTCEQIGMRATAMLFVCRPDYLDGRSLEKLTTRTRQNLDHLVVDFRSTFAYRETPHQRAKHFNAEIKHV